MTLAVYHINFQFFLLPNVVHNCTQTKLAEEEEILTNSKHTKRRRRRRRRRKSPHLYIISLNFFKIRCKLQSLERAIGHKQNMHTIFEL
jgi:hypothetical protein